MVKIKIMNWEDFSKIVATDIKTGEFKIENDVIYAESIDAARKLMTNERLRMLSTVKKEKPGSLYELAKMMKKNFKTIVTDANILSDAGLMQLETRKDGARTKVRPHVEISKIELECIV